MSGPYRRKRTPKGNLEISKKYRTRRRTKDLDQIHQDMKNPQQALEAEIDPDMPGGGHYYCLHCTRHFIDDATLQAHLKTKLHKKRLKNLAETPYTIEESLAAGGVSANAFYKK